MIPKIFITPWISLTDHDIDKLIDAGANSARIHTGKLILNQSKIHKLIDYYYSRNFKFYLDLTGNKPRAEKVIHTQTNTLFNIGDEVIISSRKSVNVPISKNHNLISTYLPHGIDRLNKADLNVDDGNLILGIKEVVYLKNKINYLISNVTYNKQKTINILDGISSTNLNIHSGYKNILTNSDITILKNIPSRQKDKVKFIVLSFVENFEQIERGIKNIQTLGFKDFQLVPKIETVIGIQNLNEICEGLKSNYGLDVEVQIGRGDLSLDSIRGKDKYDYNDLVDQAIKVCGQHKVRISILAQVMQSSRQKFKLNPNTNDLTPSEKDITNIVHLCDQNIYQIGLTNDMYIDKPERMVGLLLDIISNPIV